MMCINCASFPDSLLESELFGYEKGAFTGAHTRKHGLLEAAHGSTILLDEVADMAAPTQAKMLRAIQEKDIRRIGGTETIRIDVRYIAATNKNLEDAVSAGEFREDLFYRLNIIPIVIPPLRQRPEDIEPMVIQVLNRHGKHRTIHPDVMTALGEYRWPGNVRELEAVIERMAVLSAGTEITTTDLPDDIKRRSSPDRNAACILPREGIVFESWEKSLIEQALQQCNGLMTEAAKLLGMTYRTFQYRCDKFGIIRQE
jgi:transcriptional regulator with PAS, ATPase and Fis domain